MQDHLKACEENEMKEVSCPHKDCNEVFTKSEIDDHVQNCPYKKQHAASTSPPNSPKHLMAQETSITQQCCFSFVGCPFVGNKLELSEHMATQSFNLYLQLFINSVSS